MGDSELVINQVNDSYQTKHTRMRAYRNEVWDMFGNYFIEHNIKVIPRDENTVDLTRWSLLLVNSKLPLLVKEIIKLIL